MSRDPIHERFPPRRRRNRHGTVAFACLLLCVAACAPTLPPASSRPLRGYVHNSYHRADPVAEALELGYRGLEVDLFLRDGELRVGHGEGELRAGRTLRSLYLEPLHAAWERAGRLRDDGRPFLVNVDLKEPDPAAYRALEAALAAWGDFATRVEGGGEARGAIDVVLVGWLPPSELQAEFEVTRVALHARWPHLPADHETVPASRLRLFSARYDRLLRWRGEGRLPDDDRRRLRDYVNAAHAVDGRLCRVHGAPRDPRVYRALLDAGVDLVGAKNPRRSALPLARAAAER